MDIYAASEQAYKNGYEAGRKDSAKQCNEISCDTIHDIIENAMKSKDRYITMYFGADGISVSIYPLIDDYEMYK